MLTSLSYGTQHEVSSCVTETYRGLRTCNQLKEINTIHLIGARLLATGWTTQAPIQWVPGVLSLGVKRPWREADHSLPNKKMWIYISTPPYAFMA
jgi:hypothetical protein